MARPLSSKIPIAQLGPHLEAPRESSVHGIVTLVWPYASSTRSLSLLLVEPDFRLRRQRGQVRIRFQGSSAKAVARAGVGSGDSLALSLQGALWEQDATIATTPGRGIEWALEYGEFVDLEIQHSGQPPTQLLVDHPSLSPEPARQASSPFSSLLYNAHLPQTPYKSRLPSQNDNTGTWSSPAFLKRSHFTATKYDSFAELEEEFPDNLRKKKTKFGRGSEQWRFVGNAPSPEKEEGEGPIPVPGSSPSSPEVVLEDAGQETEQQAMLATPPMEDASVLEHADSLTARKNLDAEMHESMPRGILGPHGAETGGLEDATAPPIHEDPSHEHDEHDERVRSSKEHKGPSPDTQHNQDELARHATQTLLRRPSLSTVSSINPSSTTDSNDSKEGNLVRDNLSDAFWSNSASDVGLDGAVMSSLRKTTRTTPMASEIGRRWVEMQDAASNLRKTRISSQSREIERSKTPSGNARVTGGQAPEVEPDKPKNGAQSRAEVVQSSIDQHTKLLDSSGQHLQVTEPNSRDVPTGYANDGKPDAIHSTQKRKPDGLDVAKDTVEEQNQSEVDYDQGFDVNKTEQMRSTIEEGGIVHQNQDDEDLPRAVETQESVIISGAPVETAHPQTEVIDLGSENGTDSQHQSPTTPDRAVTSPLPQDINQQIIQSIESRDISTKNDDDDVELQQGPRSERSSLPSIGEPSEADENESSRANAALSLTEESISRHQDEKDAIDNEQRHLDLPEITNNQSPLITVSESTASGTIDQDVAFSQMTPDTAHSKGRSEELLPSQKIPSTVRDIYENSLSQVLSNSESHSVNSMQESNAPSFSLLPADGTLPNLDPAKSNLLTTTPQKFDYLGHLDQFPSQEQPAEPLAINAKALDINNAAKRDLEALVSQDIVKEVDAQPSGTKGKAEPTQRSTSESRPEIPVSEEMDGESSKTQSSSVIARLKELRRLSSQTPRRQSSGGSAKQWFAPQVSDQTDLQSEAERDLNLKSPGHIQEHPLKTPTSAASGERERRLSLSFIRSPPPQSPSVKSLSSFTQESQYLPPSQVATGFRTNFSYFVPLSSLHTHYGTTVDVLVIAISSTAISRAKTGPKDYNQTLYLSDPSSSLSNKPSALTKAQIFRPRKLCFPSINSGDAVLLRNFKVHSFRKALSLISTDASAWAVFRQDTDVQIHGSPVEYGPEERAFARAQRAWWASIDDGLSDKLFAAVPKTQTDRAQKGLGFDLTSTSQQPTTSSTRSDGLPSPRYRSLRSGRSLEPPAVGQEEAEGKEGTKSRRVLRFRTTQGQGKASPEKDDLPKEEEIHELRDGTKYVDRKGLDAGDVEAQSGVHELRDGTKYRDGVKK